MKPYRLRRKKDIIFPERKRARTLSKPLSIDVILMRSEKMKARYMKQDV